MMLDLTASSVDLTRAICDIPSVSGDEKALADAIEQAISAYPHLEVIRHRFAVRNGQNQASGAGACRRRRRLAVRVASPRHYHGSPGEG